MEEFVYEQERKITPCLCARVECKHEGWSYCVGLKQEKKGVCHTACSKTIVGRLGSFFPIQESNIIYADRRCQFSTMGWTH